MDITDGFLRDSTGAIDAVEVGNKLESVPGLFGTNAAKFTGKKIKLPNADALNNFTNQLTLETRLFLEGGNKEINGVIFEKNGSYKLEITKKDHRLKFEIRIEGQGKQKTFSDPLPLEQWIHIAAMYDGNEVALFVNGVKQSDVIFVSGNIERKDKKEVVLGGGGFRGIMEELRVSNLPRDFSGITPEGGTEEEQTVLRSFCYSGWQVIEEREKIDSSETAKVTRQYVDGVGIDEHLTQDVYNDLGTAIEKTRFYHENARGDTIALTDESGNVVVRLEYSSYGEAFKVNELGELEPFTDVALLTYGFQGRRIDIETNLYFFRNRFYDQKQGRFLSRDKEGYIDGLNLYSVLANNPNSYSDPLGNTIESDINNAVKKIVERLQPIIKAIPVRSPDMDALRVDLISGEMYDWLKKLQWQIGVNAGKIKVTLHGDPRGYVRTTRQEVYVCRLSEISRTRPYDERFHGEKVPGPYGGRGGEGEMKVRITLDPIVNKDLLNLYQQDLIKPQERYMYIELPSLAKPNKLKKYVVKVDLYRILGTMANESVHTLSGSKQLVKHPEKSTYWKPVYVPSRQEEKDSDDAQNLVREALGLKKKKFNKYLSPDYPGYVPIGYDWVSKFKGPLWYRNSPGQWWRKKK